MSSNTGNNPFGKPATEEEEDDDSFELDGTDKTSSFSVPEGMYRMRVIELEKSVSKAGKPMWVWTFLLMQGPEGGLGKELKCFTSLSAAAQWRINQVVNALALPTVDGKMKLSKKDIINKECIGVITDQEYDGKTNSSIGDCYALESDEGKEFKKMKLPKYES